MKAKEKKSAIWTWTVAIIVGHIIAYYNDVFGIDQLIPCVLGYFAIAVILITAVDEDEYEEVVEKNEKHELLDLQLQKNKPLTSNNMKIPNKTIHIFGGGTFNHVRNHLALCAPAFGSTAKRINELCHARFDKMDIHLHLTKMADSNSTLVTNEDVLMKLLELKADYNTKIVFLNSAMCDFFGSIADTTDTYSFKKTPSGKHAERLKTKDGDQMMILTPAPKVLKQIREGRKDIFLVAFKTTCGATEQEQYLAGLDLMKKNSCNLVLANDTKTHVNMIITPEEAKYHVTTDREEALKQLVDIAFYRSHLSFTRATVVEGTPVDWNSDLVYPSLRTVVNHCISSGAYKPFNGATVGHFACKIGEKEFLTSIRKSNFNDLPKTGLVKVVTDSQDTVTAYGAKPSVGGQSQRIIFSEHNDYDCIVHFHCPIKANSSVPVVSQREFECGSHQCGQNTSNGLKRFGNLSAVMLDNHGPNIVFHHSIDPQEVIDFIDQNFDLTDKTGGLVSITKENKEALVS